MVTLYDDNHVTISAFVTISFQFLFFIFVCSYGFDKITNFAGCINFVVLAVLTLFLAGVNIKMFLLTFCLIERSVISIVIASYVMCATTLLHHILRIICRVSCYLLVLYVSGPYDSREIYCFVSRKGISVWTTHDKVLTGSSCFGYARYCACALNKLFEIVRLNLYAFRIIVHD